MSKFKELVKSVLKEAGNYPDDFDAAKFDAIYGGEDEMEYAEWAFAVSVDGIITNDANTSPEDPLDLDKAKQIPHVSQEDYVGIAKKQETIDLYGMYEVASDLLTEYDDDAYYNVFNTKEQAEEVLTGFQELNPQATLKIVDVYSLDEGNSYQISK